MKHRGHISEGCRWLTALVLLTVGLWQGLVAAQPDRLYTSLEQVDDPAQVYRLRLRHRRLTELPAVVTEMSNLRELDLRGNRLTGLPERVGRLRNLRRLEVSRNPLTELPDSLAALPELRELILWDTRVRHLPAGFAALDGQLEVIDLRSCPLNTDNQKAIEALLPSVKKLWDYACDCGEN